MTQFLRQWGNCCLLAATTLAAIGICERAARAGLNADALSLLGCNFLRFPILIVATLTWAKCCDQYAGWNPTKQTPRTILMSALSVLGCVGLFFVWPAIVLLGMTPLLVPNRERLIDRKRLALGLSLILFVATWFCATSTTRRAMHAMGQRIENRAGINRFASWAKSVLSEQSSKDTQVIDPKLWPDYVSDVIGPGQGVRSIHAIPDPTDPRVVCFVGGSAFHFTFTIRPTPQTVDLFEKWYNEQTPELLEAGIALGTGGK